MRHVTHDKDIMNEVSTRCAVKFPNTLITEEAWNLMYDHVLCDNILSTIQWKMEHLTLGVSR
jgi:hypothetical protein